MALSKRQQRVMDIINAPIPASLKRQRSQAGQTLTYINAYTVVRLLNSAFGIGGWSFAPASDTDGRDIRWVEEAQPNKKGYAGFCAHVLGELRIYNPTDNGYDYNCYAAYRAYGSKVVLGGNQDNQSLYKAAESDALKKCASYVGIGAELYLSDAESDTLDQYDNMSEPEESEDVIWTEQLMEEHAKEWDYIKKFMEDHELTADDINEAIKNEWSNGKYETADYILPEDLPKFVEFLKANDDTPPEEVAS